MLVQISIVPNIESPPISVFKIPRMSVIVDHDYSTGVLRYRMVTDEQRAWVDADEMTDTSLIRNYWERVREARARDLLTIPPTQFAIREPTRLIEVRHEHGETYVLSEIEGIDVPVLVPIKLLENGYPQKLVDFFETKLNDLIVSE
jgi:hypothetical protein